MGSLPGSDPNIQTNWTAAEAEAQVDGWIDLMNSADVAKITGSLSVTADKVGTYKWVTIGWMPYIKVKGKLTLSDGTTTLYTHQIDTSKAVPTPAEVSAMDENTDVAFNSFLNNLSITTPWTNDATHPEYDEAIVKLNNGGNYFALPSPLEITAADVDAGTAFKVDLVFNPEAYMQGGDCLAPYGLEDGTYGAYGAFTGYGLEVPMLDLSAIAVPATSTLVRETYTFQVVDDKGGLLNNENEYYGGRIALFYDGSDATKGIKGLEYRLLPNPSSDTNPTTNVVPLTRMIKITSVVEELDGSLSLNDGVSASPITVIGGLVRKTTIGETGTVSFTSANPGRTTLITGVTYTLASIDTLP